MARRPPRIPCGRGATCQAEQWTKDTDGEGDGQRADSRDGRALWYWLDTQTDTLWVRLVVHGAIDEELPAVSLAFDVDDDQETGMP